MAGKSGSMTSKMSPAGLAFLGVGSFVSAYGKYSAEMSEASAESKNAAFFREQAAFASEAGQRKEEIFNRESNVLFGEQQSAFAKAGIDSSNSSFFMATQAAQRQGGAYAIEQETALNVKLAQSRAEEADQHAKDLTQAAPFEAAGSLMTSAASAAILL